MNIVNLSLTWVVPSFAEVMSRGEQLARNAAVHQSRHGGYALEFQAGVVERGGVMVSSCRAHRDDGCDRPRLGPCSAAPRAALRKRDD